jgi:hypothetical protein
MLAHRLAAHATGTISPPIYRQCLARAHTTTNPAGPCRAKPVGAQPCPPTRAPSGVLLLRQPPPLIGWSRSACHRARAVGHLTGTQRIPASQTLTSGEARAGRRVYPTLPYLADALAHSLFVGDVPKRQS